MQTDPISDFLTSIRNAVAAKHQRVDVPASRLKSELARILKEEGYISTFKMVDENKSHKTLRVFLKYTPDRRSVISGKRTRRAQSECRRRTALRSLVKKVFLEKFAARSKRFYEGLSQNNVTYRKQTNSTALRRKNRRGRGQD